MDDASARITITADLNAPSVARRFVEEFCAGLPGEFTSNAKLLVSELVTNSALHSGAIAGIELTLFESTIGIRGTVTDAGDGFDHTRNAAPGSARGWGLRIVDKLADEWGVQSAPGRTTVWFELGLEARAPKRRAKPGTRARMK